MKIPDTRKKIFIIIREEITCQRRATVLDIMGTDDAIDQATYQKAQQQPLTDVTPQENGYSYQDYFQLFHT